MRRISGVLALMAGAALIASSTGAALGQEEDPPPEGTGAAEEPAAEMAEPSALDIIDVAADKTANKPLAGKKLRKAVAKAAPAAAAHVVDSTGEDAVAQIIGLSLAARAADEAGDPKLAMALIDVATLLYRNTWTAEKSDPLAMNRALEDAIVAAYPQGHPALVLSALPYEDVIDICLTKEGSWIYNPQTPTLCEEEAGGRMARVDYALIDESKNSQPGLYTGSFKDADVGGPGIHRIVQDKTANDRLAGKKYKKALTKGLKKHGATIVRQAAGGPDSTPEQQVIELVLAAREADEAGNAKAAKAFMALALATYRSIVPKPAESTINTEALNYSIAGLISADYAEAPGLTLMTPPDMATVCVEPKGSKCMWGAGDHTPWECDDAGLVLKRMPPEEAIAAGCEF